MQRDDWTFEYTASKLADGATRKRAHHAERLKYWQGLKDGVMKEIKDSGIEVTESQATYTSNRGMAPQVMVRNDLQLKLMECHNKIGEHSQKLREYEGWVQVLEAHPEARLALDNEDFLFFFSASSASGDV